MCFLLVRCVCVCVVLPPGGTCGVCVSSKGVSLRPGLGAPLVRCDRKFERVHQGKKFPGGKNFRARRSSLHRACHTRSTRTALAMSQHEAAQNNKTSKQTGTSRASIITEPRSSGRCRRCSFSLSSLSLPSVLSCESRLLVSRKTVSSLAPHKTPLQSSCHCCVQGYRLHVGTEETCHLDKNCQSSVCYRSPC